MNQPFTDDHYRKELHPQSIGDEVVLLDLVPRLSDPNLVALLAQSVGSPTPEKLEAISAHYRTDAAWRLFGIEEDRAVVGCIGIMLNADATAVIRHIAVAPQHRGRGIGRLMIEMICAQYKLRQLSAETDSDAVAFYRRCGFEVSSLGERYPGTERFQCVMNLSAHSPPSGTSSSNP